MPAEEKRDSEAVTAQLAKEVQLRHRAPIIAIQILDNNGHPLPDSFEIKKGRCKIPSVQGHRVLICSEEQFKLFNLPNLKPLNKFKLTAHEGSRARRIGIAQFVSKSDDKVSEYGLIVLTNQGDISILSIPDLRRQFLTPCTKREDISGISSLVFTKQAEGFYLHSASEFKRFSLSARRIVDATCKVILPEGVRPKSNPSETRPPIAAASVVSNETIKEQPTEKPEEDDHVVEDDINEQHNNLDINEDANDEVIIDQDTPTSGIEESPVKGVKENKQTFLTEIINHTVELNHETLNHENLNGNGADSDNVSDQRSISPNVQPKFDDFNTTNESSQIGSLDITVDSVKDHLA